MKLTISRDSLNSSYTQEDGRVVYKVQTTSLYSAIDGGVKEETKISKILPDGIPRRQGSNGMEDRFAHLARIEWSKNTSHDCGHSTIGTIYRTGEELQTDSLFLKETWVDRRLRSCVFTSEGCNYTWSSSSSRKERLSLQDENNVKLASFHIEAGPGRGILHRKCPILEISNAGEGIADTIMLSFLYIEKVQRERLNQVASRVLQTIGSRIID